jgi:transposase
MSKRREVDPRQLAAALERAKGALSPEDWELFKQTADTLAFLTQELERKGTSIQRLRHMLFGATTEKTGRVTGEAARQERKAARDAARNAEGKPKGHGRNGAAAYTGADRVKVPHPSLHTGDACPECEQGKLYELPDAAVLVRITGVAPLGATVHECDRLRCALCGEVFTAPAPAGIGEDKYDETATGMVGLLKYGVGMPFNRIEKLQEGMGIPMPAATQWELVRDGAELLAPTHEELIRQAAQGKVLHNDDTTMKVLELTGAARAAAAGDGETDERTGVFTSGIVSTAKGQRIALFFTGVQHAGENLAEVLAKRAQELPKPIQMCDALAANTDGDFEAIVATCIAHARRRYVEVAESFPVECQYVLKTLREVYKTDAVARRQQLSATQRLALHRAESGPRMKALEEWMRAQLDEHKVEPNSGLGEAIGYMQRHWRKLTLFLRKPGVPLDNNLCERALKRAILHRKNALFYRTKKGAGVGDLYMSLIHTAELNHIQPFDYLVALLRHPQETAAVPGDWMPWSYQETLKRLSSAATPAN